MISKTSLNNLYKKEYKRHLALFGIVIFVLFCTLPFTLIRLISGYENRYGVDFGTVRSEYLVDRNTVIYSFLYENSILMVVLAACAIFMGIFLFQFLHSRQKTDFYFSMPVKRASLFWCKYLQGILYVAAAVVVNMVIVLVIAGAKNCLTSVFFIAFLQKIIGCMLYFIALYSITVTAVLVTGKTIFSFLGACTLSLYFPAIVFLVDLISYGNSEKVLKGAYHMLVLSPYTLLTMIYDSDSRFYLSEASSVELYPWNRIPLIGMVIMALAFGALSYWLFLKRPAEAAGKTIIYIPFKKVVKLCLVLAFAIGMSWILPELLGTSGIVHMAISFIVGTLLGIFILDALMELDVLAAIKKRKKQWVYILVCCIVFACSYVYVDRIKYHGFDDMTVGHTEEEAIKDGFVVLNDTGECHNKELLLQFQEDVMSGKDAKLRLARYDSYNGGLYGFIIADYI